MFHRASLSKINVVFAQPAKFPDTQTTSSRHWWWWYVASYLLTYDLKLLRIPRATIQPTAFQGTKNAWFHDSPPSHCTWIPESSSPQKPVVFRLQSVALLTSLAAVHGTKCWASIVLLKFRDSPVSWGSTLSLYDVEFLTNFMALVHQTIFFTIIASFFGRRPLFTIEYYDVLCYMVFNVHYGDFTDDASYE